MKTYDILCLAELAIDDIGDTDKINDNPSSVIIKRLRRFYGGMGGNFCASASVFNPDLSIIAYLGKDPEGIEYKKHLEEKEIDISHLLQNEWSSHARCFIANENEKTRIFFYPGALMEHPTKYLAYAKSLINNISAKALFCASMNIDLNIFYLKNSKCKLKAFAPAHNTSLISKGDFEIALENTNILFLNSLESQILEKLLGLNLFEIAKKFNIDILIRTLGRDGSEIIVDGRSTMVLPCKADREVDRTGAGDAFAGTFVANYIKTKDSIYSAKIASALASFVVEELGCQTNIPTLELLKARVKENYKINLK